MNNRFLVLFVIGLLIIVIAVIVILGLFLGLRVGSSPAATSTPASVAAGVTVRNDTANAVQVQDCTAALSACASSNMGTTRLAAGASGTEHGATGLRILSLQGHVMGCITLNGVSNGTTVLVSSEKACP